MRTWLTILAACILLPVPGQEETDGLTPPGWEEPTEQSPYIPVDPRTEPYLDVEFNPELNAKLPLNLEFMADDGMREGVEALQKAREQQNISGKEFRVLNEGERLASKVNQATPVDQVPVSK